MQTASYTDLRNNLKSYFDRVVDDSETIIVSRSEGKAVVLLSLDEYNSIKETEYVMSFPQVMSDIRQGEKDLAEGKGIELDISSL